MNNDYFLHTAMHGEYPKAFVSEPPYEALGFKSGDDKIMRVPLDWIGFHYYTRRIGDRERDQHLRHGRIAIIVFIAQCNFVAESGNRDPGRSNGRDP
jgi:beta-glucosidase/6-phospho-beta-glucosidase/beta-galactosidase